MGPDDPDRPVKLAHAALHRAGEPLAFGGGVLLAPGTVLTCAHVVNQVLDRPDFAQERPETLDLLAVSFPATGRRRLRAALAAWLPARRADGSPAAQGDVEWSGDLALLRLLDAPDPPALPVATGRCHPGRPAYAWFGSGAPSSIAAVLVQGVTERWIVLDSTASAQPVVNGYSGSPLWDRAQRRVVGLVVSRSGLRAFAVPAAGLYGLFREAGEEVPGPPGSGGDGVDGAADDPVALVARQLLGPLRVVLATPEALAAVAGRFLAELEPEWGAEAGADPGAAHDPFAPDPLAPDPLAPEDGTADDARDGGTDGGGRVSAERLARLAAALPHGAPTLLALLAGSARTQEQRSWVATTALRACPEQFLTAAEHRELLALLADGSVPDPRGCAAEALPLGPDLEPADWPGAVAELERYRPRYGRFPQLLRTVEFAAAAAGAGAARGLGAWSEAVAQRLDLAEILLEHRAQARESAERARERGPRRGASAPVVQVQLWRATGTECFTYALHAADARGRVLHRSVRDTPVPRARLLAELAVLLEDVTSGAEPGSVPVVEWFVAGEELDLAVDQWVYRPDELFPGVLGQDFLCVMRSPELRRAAFRPEHRYRWQALRSGRLALVERHDPVVQQRGAPVPVCGVALCCPAEEVPRLRAIALAVGVPGVLWLRPGEHGTPPGRVRELVRGAAPHQLPRLVYETRLTESPDGLHRNLALVWDSPDGHPQALGLGDPRD
ncbi:trypsin-like peptidase domain-containing protein [Kitasatospora sp. NPDC101176]|uniref:trypsin-like peptidase domain-containing protein n=1 Tax=Kitasatospora sp. NPDC101176 TaxID=3364099 RepID=UPI0037FD2DCD